MILDINGTIAKNSIEDFQTIEELKKSSLASGNGIGAGRFKGGSHTQTLGYVRESSVIHCRDESII